MDRLNRPFDSSGLSEEQLSVIEAVKRGGLIPVEFFSGVFVLFFTFLL